MNKKKNKIKNVKVEKTVIKKKDIKEKKNIEDNNSEKFKTKDILTIFTFCILVGVPFLKQLSYYLAYYKVITSYDILNPALVIFISLPFLIFVYIKDLKNRKLDIFDYLFYLLILAGILSCAFAIDKEWAIFGKEYRHEGFLSVLGYYLLFINWKINGTKEDSKLFLKLLMVIGILNSIYTLLQIYTPFDFIIRYGKDKYMAPGLCGNPNFLGSLMVTVLCVVVCKFLMEKKFSWKTFLLLILFTVALINAQSTGPYIAFIVSLLFIIIFLWKKKNIYWKKLLVLIATLVVVYTSVFYVNKLVMKSERCEACDIQKTVDSGGTGRLKLWENTLDIVKDNFLLGVGFDNFQLAYKPNYTMYTESGALKKVLKIKDCAHNVYLHILTVNGIVGLIPYLLVCLLTFIHGLKSKSKTVFLLLAGFVAYSVQAFANISVIQVAPLYYVMIGLILSIKE